MDYPCTSCGECCRRVQSVLEVAGEGHPILKELVDRFPYKTKEDGSCEMLTDDGRCSVYEHRPLVCNIKLGQYLFKMTQEEWFKWNMEGCNQMMDEAGIDERYRVSL